VATAPPNFEPLWDNPFPSYISEYGLAAVTAFLAQFPLSFNPLAIGVFTFPWEENIGNEIFFDVAQLVGYKTDDGRFNVGTSRQPKYEDEPTFFIGFRVGEGNQWHNWTREPIYTSIVPPIFSMFHTQVRDGINWLVISYFDNEWNPIEDVPWINEWGLFASGFSLWDFDHTGIPDVLVYYWGNYTGSTDGGTPTVLFRYINGAYQPVYERRYTLFPGGTFTAAQHWLPWDEYFFDEDGNLIAYFYGIVQAIPMYVAITFEGTSARYERIASGTYDFDSWDQDLWDWQNPHLAQQRARFFWENYRLGIGGYRAGAVHPWMNRETPFNRRIPLCGTKLFPVQRLTELEAELLNKLNR